MTITCNSLPKEKELDGLLSSKGRDAMVKFLNDVSSKMPDRNWLAKAMSRMTGQNQNYASRGGVTSIGDLDVRQLLNILSSCSEELIRHKYVPANFGVKCSAVWTLMKSFSHYTTELDNLAFREILSDVLSLMRMIDKNSDIISDLENMLLRYSRKPVQIKMLSVEEIIALRKSQIESFRKYHENIYNEFWCTIKENSSCEKILFDFYKSHKTRLCLKIENATCIIDCPHEMYLVFDRNVDEAENVVELKYLTTPILSEFWIDLLRSVWENITEMKRWCFNDISLSKRYCVRLKSENGEQIEFVISTVRIMLERHGHEMLDNAKYVDDRCCEQDADFVAWRAGKSSGEKFFRHVALMEGALKAKAEYETQL